KPGLAHLDRAKLGQLGFPSFRLGLDSLLAGECLALLVDYGTFVFKTDLDGVTDHPVGLFRALIIAMDCGGTHEVSGGTSYRRGTKTPENTRKWY
ncbi:MAG: hypothetical protein RSE94_14715, partial [Pseudomonas sp.]